MASLEENFRAPVRQEASEGLCEMKCSCAGQECFGAITCRAVTVR